MFKIIKDKSNATIDVRELTIGYELLTNKILFGTNKNHKNG